MQASPTVSAPASFGGLDRAEHVRRPAARGDADDGIVRADAELGHGCGAAVALVLGVLDGHLERARAAREHPDDLARRGR